MDECHRQPVTVGFRLQHDCEGQSARPTAANDNPHHRWAGSGYRSLGATRLGIDEIHQHLHAVGTVVLWLQRPSRATTNQRL
jgi:hypothetical protein